MAQLSLSTVSRQSTTMPFNGVKVVQSVSVAIIAAVVISPLLALFVGSLKPDRFQILADMGSFRAFWVDNPSLANYAEIATFSGATPMARYLVNSIVILAITVAAGIVVNSMAAFVLARGRFPGRALLLSALIGLYIVPQESIVLPLLSLITRLGLADSFAALILPSIASPLYIFLLYQFFIQIPDDIYDAARVDGALPFSIYWRIYLPMSAPALATVAILQGIESWNQYLWPLMVTQTDWARPISVGIAAYFGHDTVYWNTAFAASVMMMAPVLLFYLLFQRWFVASMIGSAVKG